MEERNDLTAAETETAAGAEPASPCGGRAKQWLKTIAAILACLLLLLGESLLQYANGETEAEREIPVIQESAGA